MRKILGLALVLFVFVLNPALGATTTHNPDGSVTLDANIRIPFSTVRGPVPRLVEFFGYWENDTNLTLGYRYKDANFWQALNNGVYCSCFGISLANFNLLQIQGFPVTVVSGNLNLPAFMNALEFQNKITFPYSRNDDLNIDIGGVANIFLATKQFRLHMPIETATNGHYNFHSGTVTISQEFTVLNPSDWNAPIQEKRFDSFFHNFIKSARVYYWDTNKLDSNTSSEGWRLIRPFHYWFGGKKYFHYLIIKAHESARFKIEYNVAPNSSGKYDLLFNPEPEGVTLDPYWVLSGNNGFDPREMVYPTLHDFNKTYLNPDQNLTFNGMLDWNNETANQILSDENLIFWITFNDYNSTAFFDLTDHNIDFNRNTKGGGQYQPGNFGILNTFRAQPCDPYAAEYCNMMNSDGQYFSNLPVASFSVWIKDDQAIYDDNSVLFQSDNNLLKLWFSISSERILAQWGTSTITECNLLGSWDPLTGFPWWHVVVVGGSPNRIYFDGKECPSYISQGNYSSSGTVSAVSMAPFDLATDPFGMVSFEEARFYDRALSAADVNQLFLYGALDRNLVFYYKFNTEELQHFNYARYSLQLITQGAAFARRGMFDTNGAQINSELTINGFQSNESSILDCGALNDCTFLAWVYPTNTASNLDVVYIRHATLFSNQQQYALRLNPPVANRRTVSFLGANGSSSLVHSSNESLDLNRWHHIGFVWSKDENRVQIWIDGNLDTNSTFAWALSGGTANPQIMGGGVFGSLNFVGRLDEVKLWNRKLSNDEIISDYNGWFKASYVSRVFSSDENSPCLDCNFSIGNILFDANASMSDLNVQTRVCTNATCSTNPSFVTENGFVGTDQNFYLNNGVGLAGNFFQFRLPFDANFVWPRNEFDNNFVHVQKAQFWYNAFPISVLVLYPNVANLILFEDFWIDFNVVYSGASALGVLFDVNLSIDGARGTGQVVVSDGNVASTNGLYCDSNNLGVGVECHALVRVDNFSSGRYKALVLATAEDSFDWNSADFNFFLLGSSSGSRGFIVLPSGDDSLWVVGVGIALLALFIVLVKK